MIRSFGGDVPIFIILNKIDQHPNFELNYKALNEKYSKIVGYYKMSCIDGEGVDNFKENLLKFTENDNNDLLLNTPIPTSWAKIKRFFEESKDNHQTYNEFEKIISENNIPIEQKEVLLKFLHELGVMLNFNGNDEILKEYFILNPKWVTDAAYKIINSTIVKTNNGVLEMSKVEEVLNKEKFLDKEYDTLLDEFQYCPSERSFIVSLLKEFKLAFSLDNGVLIPDLLDVQEPDYDFDKTDCIEIFFKYDFLPSSIIPQFIVIKNNDIKEKNLVWKSGVYLKSKDFNSEALVISDYEDKIIKILVNGKNKREYLIILRDVFNKIHKTFENINPELFLVIQRLDAKPVNYEYLKQLEEEGEKYYRPHMNDGQMQKQEIKILLGDIRSKEDIEKNIYFSILEKISEIENKLTEKEIEKEILILQPNISGIGIDLKALTRKIWKNIKETNTFFPEIE